MTLDEAMKLVRKEVERDTKEGPEWPRKVVEAAYVVYCEAEGLLDNETKKQYREAAISTAAMAVRFLVHINAYDIPKD